jgi:hemerythrin superfamily protein
MAQATATTTTIPRDRRAGGPTLAPVDTGAAVDAGQMLEALHRRVERQFQAYEAAEGSHVRQRRAVRAIAKALATHVTVEDELLYPALRAQTGRHDGEVERQRQQDHVLDLLLVELAGMIPSERGYDAKVGVLMQVFRQHARDAEALVIPELRGRLDPAEHERLGRRLAQRVGQLESRPRKGW